MSDRIKPLLGALVAIYVINFTGVTLIFGPILADDVPTGELAPVWLSLAIVAVLLLIFYDWVNQAVGSPVKSTMIIAVSQ